MKQERMKILEMLEEGKITADEATKLLDAMKRPQSSEGWFDSETVENVEDKFKKFTKHVDNFTREFGGRVETLYKEVEPKLKKASHTVLEKTASVFDDISKSLNESLENARKAAESCCDGEPDCCCDDDAPKEN